MSSAIAADTWYHITVTYDGANHIIYLGSSSEPTAISTNAYTGTPSTNSVELILGNDHNDTSDFDGKIGAFKFYKKALTLSEVQADYNATKSTYI